MSSRKVRSRFHGSSLRKRIQASKVAPPQHSTDQKPALSISSQAATMSSKAIRVANRLWCASRRATSVTPIFRGLIALTLLQNLRSRLVFFSLCRPESKNIFVKKCGFLPDQTLCAVQGTEHYSIGNYLENSLPPF